LPMPTLVSLAVPRPRDDLPAQLVKPRGNQHGSNRLIEAKVKPLPRAYNFSAAQFLPK